jgi:hypothetical protein
VIGAIGLLLFFSCVTLFSSDPEPPPPSRPPPAGSAGSAGATSPGEITTATAPDPEAILAALAKIKQSKPSKSVTSGEVTVTVMATKSGKKWIYDRNDAEYSYAEADKDSQYHWLDLDIASESKEPQLPALFACRFSVAGEFEGCHPLRFEFHRWDDYGSYLGNYADSGNDFAKRDSVKFTAAFTATDTELASPTIIVAVPGCQTRQQRRFQSPPEYYVSACLPPGLEGEVGLGYVATLPVLEILNKKALVEAIGGRMEVLQANAPTK